MLERERRAIGVVTGIQGRVTSEVVVSGRAGHAGTVPHDLRDDALDQAVNLFIQLRSAMLVDPDVRFTVGKFEVSPGSPSVIPDRVTFSLDLRHPDKEKLAMLSGVVETLVKSYPSANLQLVDYSEPTVFPDSLVSMIEDSAAHHSSMRLISGAVHDSQKLALFCTTAMIFIPCEGGISHHEAEYASAEDMTAGTQVLLNTILKIAS